MSLTISFTNRYIMTRGGAVWKLVGLITRRSQVQILSPLLRFTICNYKKNAQIAQLVEQRTENPRVAGSIPALGTLKINLDWFIFFLFFALHFALFC